MSFVLVVILVVPLAAIRLAAPDRTETELFLEFWEYWVVLGIVGLAVYMRISRGTK